MLQSIVSLQKQKEPGNPNLRSIESKVGRRNENLSLVLNTGENYVGKYTSPLLGLSRKIYKTGRLLPNSPQEGKFVIPGKQSATRNPVPPSAGFKQF
jgi:hypothetical protein